MCRTLCIHHSNGCLEFHKFVKGMTKLLLELFDKYRQEFPLEKLFDYSTSFKMKGMPNASAHFHGYVNHTSLVLTEGKMRLDTIDMEGVLECEGTNHSLSQIVLIFCIACRLSSVLSYFKSIQVLAHLNYLYPATKLDTYLHRV